METIHDNSEGCDESTGICLFTVFILMVNLRHLCLTEFGQYHESLLVRDIQLCQLQLDFSNIIVCILWLLFIDVLTLLL